MKFYNIAGLSVGVEGVDSAVADKFLYKYDALAVDCPDMMFCFKQVDSIALPEGKIVANVHQRLWMRSEDGGYIAVELGADVDSQLSDHENIYLINDQPLPRLGTHYAKITINSSWTHIDIETVDISKYTQVDEDTRAIYIIGEMFRYGLPLHGGMVIHSSSIDYLGKGILFSAPSGTGKSTHTGLWREYYPETIMINDDTPAIMEKDGGYIAFGTPWSGKTRENNNVFAPLSAIVFLQQSEENRIYELSGVEAIRRLFAEVRVPVFDELMHLILETISGIIKSVPVYLLECNISREAVELVKKTIT